MKPLPQIRRERFLELVQEAGGPTEVAKRLDPEKSLGSRKSQVSQWSRESEANGARNIGHTSARMLERLFERPRGWMDTDPDSLSPRDEHVRNSPSSASYAARLDASILASALGVIGADEAVNGPYPLGTAARLILDLYQQIEAGESPLELVAKLTNQRQGDPNVAPRTTARQSS